MDHIMFARVLEQQAQMLALYTEVEAMKTANTERLANNESVAYPKEEFDYMAVELRNVANILHQIGHM